MNFDFPESEFPIVFNMSVFFVLFFFVFFLHLKLLTKTHVIAEHRL